MESVPPELLYQVFQLTDLSGSIPKVCRKWKSVYNSMPNEISEKQFNGKSFKVVKGGRHIEINDGMVDNEGLRDYLMDYFKTRYVMITETSSKWVVGFVRWSNQMFVFKRNPELELYRYITIETSSYQFYGDSSQDWGDDYMVIQGDYICNYNSHGPFSSVEFVNLVNGDNFILYRDQQTSWGRLRVGDNGFNVSGVKYSIIENPYKIDQITN